MILSIDNSELKIFLQALHKNQITPKVTNTTVYDEIIIHTVEF